ncbi:MAG TPA: hypothetical protein VN643_05640 [Pyrinomonadaceae bacterium]|nr:hypothetical protein [Pyrinomonadaceae bacterium]
MNDSRTNIDRRRFCAIAGGAAAAAALITACRFHNRPYPSDGRLASRPFKTGTFASSGEIRLGLDKERDAILRIPKSASDAPIPLLLFLHGAGQSAEDMFEYLGSVPSETRVAVLAPNSREATWDAIGGSFGPDVEFIDEALKRVFNLLPVDPNRLAVGGFSDGASYAISMGLINGDLFGRVLAFSPGFVIDGQPRGKPRFFISHGTRDHILPIDLCGRKIAADLKDENYEVTFREFDGRHEVPADIALEGLKWVAN